uniref:Uncharacterized protein n=1 Tax=Triticum urartu TaxID=4572 RepID=A0A8R7TBB3_TRIUA
MERMGHPGAGAAQLLPPDHASRHGRAPPAHRLRRAKGLCVVSVHDGRCYGNLRAGTHVC